MLEFKNKKEEYSYYFDYLSSDEQANCVIAEIKARCLGYGEGIDNDVLAIIESYQKGENIYQAIDWLTGNYFK
jgi:hypothetical protein